jgi:hypothetical protein
MPCSRNVGAVQAQHITPGVGTCFDVRPLVSNPRDSLGDFSRSAAVFSHTANYKY